jgi:hypothetical protein
MTCALALVLLLDVSASISSERFALQRDATAAALRDPAVQHAIVAQAPIAATVLQFGSGAWVAVPWRRIADAVDAAQFAAALATMPRMGGGATHVGDAIAAALVALDGAPCPFERAVIDISGDGAGNGGVPPAGPLAEAAERGITVNALPIVTDAEPELEAWFRANAITPDGRVFPADWAGFARAIRAKLVFEVAGALLRDPVPTTMPGWATP